MLLVGACFTNCYVSNEGRGPLFIVELGGLNPFGVLARKIYRKGATALESVAPGHALAATPIEGAATCRAIGHHGRRGLCPHHRVAWKVRVKPAPLTVS